jgi:hypothetical protein
MAGRKKRREEKTPGCRSFTRRRAAHLLNLLIIKCLLAKGNKLTPPKKAIANGRKKNKKAGGDPRNVDPLPGAGPEKL